MYVWFTKRTLEAKLLNGKQYHQGNIVESLVLHNCYIKLMYVPSIIVWILYLDIYMYTHR